MIAKRRAGVSESGRRGRRARVLLWRVVWSVLPALLLCPLVSSCRTRVGADPAPVRAVYVELNASALDSPQCSQATRAVLYRCHCQELFRKNPPAALRQLHADLLTEPRRDLLLALAELNYFHGDRLRRSVKPGQSDSAADFFLASAIYAFFYLRAEAEGQELNVLGSRPHLARELYNHALAQGLLAPGATNRVIRLQEGRRPLLVGQVGLRVDAAALPWPLRSFQQFVMADAYTVRGLSFRNRQAGLGAPLIATALAGEVVPSQLAVTVFLRVDGQLGEWSSAGLKGRLELYPGYPDASIALAGRRFPLEVDATAPLAYALNNPALWRLGRQQFFSGKEIFKSGIYRLQPYRPGAIPVVFVHGTFSSPIYWAEMWNTLTADPILSRRCQFWAFLYNTGNPILWSAANLRDALRHTVQELDPGGTDPALRQIVLIGHSQGGLLAKLCVVRSGDTLWHLVSDKGLDELGLPEDLNAELRRTLYVEPVVEVRRVIFVATPHRGSFLATGLIRRLAAGVVSLPVGLVQLTRTQTALTNATSLPPLLRQRLPTSLDGMSIRNPALLTLAEMRPVPGVTCHSIIAVKGHDPVEQEDDGVVAYQSAHLAYSASELVVRSAHSCQRNPEVAEEVRRILLEHLAQLARDPQWSEPNARISQLRNPY